MIKKCPICGGQKTIRKGLSHGKKRWYCKTCQTYFTHVNHKASILNICFFILSCYLCIFSAFWRADLRNLKVNFKFAQFFQHDFMKTLLKYK